jgi:hypothetical protein
MNKKLSLTLAISILLISVFSMSFVVAETQVASDSESSLTHFWNNLIHSTGTYSIVGTNRGCGGTGGTVNYQWSVDSGKKLDGSQGVLSGTAPSSIPPNSLIDIFTNGWTPFVETANFLTFDTCGSTCNLQLYTCAHPEPSSPADCSSWNLGNYNSVTCPLWAGRTNSAGQALTVYQCPTETGIPFYKSSYNYCSPINFKRCYYKPIGASVCNYYDYQGVTSCSQVGSPLGYYNGRPLFDTQTTCDGSTSCQNVCNSGAKQCNGNGVQTCNVQSNGCTDWSTAVACSSTQTCSNGACDSGTTCTDKGIVCGGSSGTPLGSTGKICAYNIQTCSFDCEACSTGTFCALGTERAYCTTVTGKCDYKGESIPKGNTQCVGTESVTCHSDGSGAFDIVTNSSTCISPIGSGDSQTLTWSEFFSISNDDFISQGRFCASVSDCFLVTNYNITCNHDKFVAERYYKVIKSQCSDWTGLLGLANWITKTATSGIVNPQNLVCSTYASFSQFYSSDLGKKTGVCIATSKTSTGKMWESLLKTIGSTLPVEYISFVLVIAYLLLFLGGIIIIQIVMNSLK